MPNHANDQQPEGTLDRIRIENTSEGIVPFAEGWAADRDAPEKSLWVHFYIDRPHENGGLHIGSLQTNLVRSDVGLPGKHGFSWPIPLEWRKGRHQLYAYAINYKEAGPNSPLKGTPTAFTASTDYVPWPKVVDNPNYHDIFSHTLGTFYMPKPSRPSHQWLEVKLDNELYHIKATKGQREPLLGYYQGDSPEVLDWQIKWAVDRNITAFVFDDYWVEGTDSPTYETSMRAFLQSQYRLHMQFAVMLVVNQVAWEGKDERKRRFLGTILPYYIRNYISQPNYLIVEGKPLIHIGYPPDTLLKPAPPPPDPPEPPEPFDPRYIRAILEEADDIIRSLTRGKYKGAYWVSGNLMAPSEFPYSAYFLKEAGFAALWSYSILPHTWPAYDTGKFPILSQTPKEVPQTNPPFYRVDVNDKWPPGIDTLKARDESENLHYRTFKGISETFGMKFITSLTIDFDTRRVFWWDQKHLYFNGYREPYWWQLLQWVKERYIEPVPGGLNTLIPIVTRTGKGLVGISHWNEQSEGTSLEPGFSEFQLYGNKDPFIQATAPAKLFGGGSLTYDEPKPASFLSRGFPDTRRWTKAALADWETAGSAGSSLDANGDLLVTASRATDKDSPIILFTAVNVPVASGSPRYLKVCLNYTSGTPYLDKSLLYWRSSTYPPTAHRFDFDFNPNQQPDPAEKQFQHLMGGVSIYDGVQKCWVFSFDVGGDPAPELRWQGSIQWLELRFPFEKGTVFKLVIREIYLE
jgi:hypothetical protein